MKKALQWWYKKKLAQLEFETELIRDRLLQESFAMRRSLEISALKSNEFNSSSCQKCITQLEDFSITLKQLSDRLYPSYLNEGLPLALKYSVTQWQNQLPNCQFKLNLPQKWQQKSSVNSFIILNILEDLLRIQNVNTLFNKLIFINLEQNKSISGLKNRLKITFDENSSELTAKRDWQEYTYIQQMFESITSGSCQNILTENSNVWLFEW